MKRFSMIVLPVILALGMQSHAAAQSVNDPGLTVQTYLRGLSQPTGVAFLNTAGDLLVTQKNDGKVLLVKNKRVVGTALDLPVANDSERGLLSIALSPNFATDKLVYLYHTAAATDGGSPISNKISRYRFDGSKLVLDRKIMDLPVLTGPNHDGGKLAFDSKGKLYAVVGDLNQHQRTTNFETSQTTQRLASIIRVQPSGAKISTNPFATGSTRRTAADDIYAYGIRNSFGIEFDPVTGRLWDTENGASSFDEINLVSPGFNSGWRDIMGPRSRNGGTTGKLVSLGPAAAYSDPEFSWAKTVAPTDLHFLRSSRLGTQYRNDLFVGDVNTGSLYHFDLTADRRGLAVGGPLADLVADNASGDLTAEQSSILFGNDFGIVSDLLDGPGGLFALSLSQGRLYRITAKPVSATPVAAAMSLREIVVPEPAAAAAGVVSAMALVFMRWRFSGCSPLAASSARRRQRRRRRRPLQPRPPFASQPGGRVSRTPS